MERDRIVEAIEELAALSELLEENPFKVRAYANGARVLAKTSLAPEGWGEPGALESVPGLGRAIAEKVRELLASGSMRKLEELRAQVPQGVRELLAVPGLGPKRARALWRGLGVSSPGELEYACAENRLVALPGFGTKTQEKILSAEHPGGQGRHPSGRSLGGGPSGRPVRNLHGPQGPCQEEGRGEYHGCRAGGAVSGVP
jgi:DNA polymerase (family 10)